MVSAVLYERRHSGGFLVSEANGARSRDRGVLQMQSEYSPSTPGLTPATTGGTLASGSYYVGITLAGDFGESVASALANAAVTGPTGDITVTSPSGLPEDVIGWNVYAALGSGNTLFLQNPAGAQPIGTNFVLTSLLTSGVVLPANYGISPILSAGLIMGKITASGNWAPWDPQASDGSQTAAGILFNETDASQTNAPITVITRECEVNGSELIYAPGATATQIANQANSPLAALGIILR